jgi:membrane-associated PAP2 superfamily phosphatase
MIALRRTWLPETGLLIGIAGLATVVFAATPLDLAAARVFYRLQGAEHWPLGVVWPSRVLYQLAPLITASLVALGLLGLLICQLRPRDALRRNCIFLILSLVIGPGLLDNAILKDHWPRPRPRDVVQFGGSLHYTPPPWRGEGGSSFPCGHCSVGFLYASGWWIWKRRRRNWARASLVLGLVLGSALGVGRMAAGAHFLSDVIWSALLALGVAHLVYEHILPPADAAIERLSIVKPRIPAKHILTVCASIGAIFVLLALFVTPHGNRFSLRLDLSSLPDAPRVLDVTAATANIEIVIEDSAHMQLLADGELHGFGLPGSRLAATTTFQSVPIPTVGVRLEEEGRITDLSAFATIHVPLGKLQRIVVRLRNGGIQVIDATRERAIESGVIRLDLKTDSGRVQVR